MKILRLKHRWLVLELVIGRERVVFTCGTSPRRINRVMSCEIWMRDFSASWTGRCWGYAMVKSHRLAVNSSARGPNSVVVIGGWSLMKKMPERMLRNITNGPSRRPLASAVIFYTAGLGNFSGVPASRDVFHQLLIGLLPMQPIFKIHKLLHLCTCREKLHDAPRAV